MLICRGPNFIRDFSHNYDVEMPEYVRFLKHIIYSLTLFS